MADEPKSPVKAPENNVGKAKGRLTSIKTYLLETYAGKPNHNPALWIARNIKPLEDELKKGSSEELLSKIFALPEKPLPIFYANGKEAASIEDIPVFTGPKRIEDESTFVSKKK